MDKLSYQSISINTIIKKQHSLAPISYKENSINDKSNKTLKELLKDYKKGFEPGSSSYVKKYGDYFIRIRDVNDYEYTFDISEKVQRIIPPSKEMQKVYKGDILYQTASNTGNVCMYMGEKPSYYNSHLIKLEFKQNSEYIFAFLKSKIAKSQISIAGSIKGIDNFRKDNLLDMEVIFPTINNYSNPEVLIKYIEDLVKNLLDKEEQIGIKSKEIDNIINSEIQSNSKCTAYSYTYPTRKKLLQESRLDTYIYSDEYKKLIHSIEDYVDGVYYLDEEKIFPGVTPKDHIYMDTKANNNFLWITPKNLDQRKLLYKTYIATQKNTRVKKNDIIFSGIRYLGNCIFIDTQEKVYCNQNTLIVRHSEDKIEQIFLLCYFSSLLGKKIKLLRRVMGTVPILYADQFARIPIPNFNKSLKEKISNIYYNKVDKENYTINTYLEKEKNRNKQVGIHQLNEEINVIKEEIEDIMKDIVMKRKIKINF